MTKKNIKGIFFDLWESDIK